MKLTELFDRVLVDSGQFLLGQADIEMNLDTFLLLTKQTLRLYDKHVPYVKRFNITVSGTYWQFVEPEIPAWIAEVIPITPQGGLLYAFFQHKKDYYNDTEKANFIWEYKKPNLIVQVGGTYDVKAVYSRQITLVADPGGDYWDLPEVDDNDDMFIALLTARFMIALGRSRSAFTLSELPVQNNGAELVTEGKELEEKALEDLANNGNWELSWS